MCTSSKTVSNLCLPATVLYLHSAGRRGGVYLHTTSDGNLFNLTRLRAKTKVWKVLTREMLFADDAALTAHSEEALQRLMRSFAQACREFGLTISLKKTNILRHDVCRAPSVQIDDYTLEEEEEFVYLVSIISSNLSLDTELDERIGKAATAMTCMSKRVWGDAMLTTKTKMDIYKACVLSSLLYGRILFTRQECKLNTFQIRCLRKIQGIDWQDRITNKDVLAKEGIQSLFALLSQRRLRWFHHVRRNKDGRIPKDTLYG